jgi:hypothetical protein
MSDQAATSGGDTASQADPTNSVAPQGSPPSSVTSAVTLMYVRAAIALVGVILVLTTKNTLRKDILKHNPTADRARLDTLVNSAITLSIVFALIFLVLYVLLAMQVRKGKNWARIVTWVFAGLGVIGSLGSLFQVAAPLSHVVSVVTGILDLAVIVLLAQQPSNDYFRRT